LLSRRAARKHLVAPRHPKYFLRPRSAGSVSPGSGRPVRLHRLRPGGSPQTLQTPPRGGRPVLRNPIEGNTARTNSSHSTGSGRSSRRFPSPAPIPRSPGASLASRPRSPIFLRPARHYPRLWLRTPLGAGPTGLPPASNTASPARTTRRSAPVPRIATLPLADLLLGVLAPDDRPQARTAPLADRPIGATGSRVPHQSPDHARATIHAGHPPGQSAGSRQTPPGATTRPRFRMSPIRFRHFIGGSLSLAFVTHT
jgi:hypothetical protein